VLVSDLTGRRDKRGIISFSSDCDGGHGYKDTGKDCQKDRNSGMGTVLSSKVIVYLDDVVDDDVDPSAHRRMPVARS